MLKDIENHTFEDIILVATPNETDSSWSIYLVNVGDELLETVMVSSSGYGQVENQRRQTSTLRWSMGDLKPKSFCKIEEVTDELISFHNEYMVTCFVGGRLKDKKAVFTPHSLDMENCELVPLLQLKGITVQ